MRGSIRIPDAELAVMAVAATSGPSSGLHAMVCRTCDGAKTWLTCN